MVVPPVLMVQEPPNLSGRLLPPESLAPAKQLGFLCVFPSTGYAAQFVTLPGLTVPGRVFLGPGSDDQLTYARFNVPGYDLAVAQHPSSRMTQ